MARFPTNADANTNTNTANVPANAGHAAPPGLAELIARVERRLAASLPYRDDAAVLADVELLLAVRGECRGAHRVALARRLRGLARGLRTRLHRGLDASPSPHLACSLRRLRLNRVEREIVLVLSLLALGMLAGRGSSSLEVDDLQRLLALEGRDLLRVPAALVAGGRLRASGTAHVEEGDLPVDHVVQLDPSFIEPLLTAAGARGAVSDDGWRVRTHEELLDQLQVLAAALVERGGEVESLQCGFSGFEAQLARSNRVVARHQRALERALQQHPAWPLARLRGNRFDIAETQVLVLLLGIEMGFHDARDGASGAALARCVSPSVQATRGALQLLRRSAPLRRQGIVRPRAAGTGELASDEDAQLKETAFELTGDALRALGVRRRRRPVKGLRKPGVSLEQLVLPDVVREAVDLVVAQDRHRRVLFDEWGLAETIPYGRGQTVLFAGPPGVGKTATAEAIAHELGRPLLSVSAAQVQNCWVGETEKTIVQAFADAREWEAVLFWDEADALFVDRDRAERSFEVRWVNVLLQEIERFEGACILATNRAWSLDAALGRRITVKVDFPAPTREACARILERLLPPALPLAADIDLASLPVAGLTGGQLKNVVLNAARRALTRWPRPEVTAEDLRVALRAERPASERRPIGIHANDDAAAPPLSLRLAAAAGRTGE